MLYELKMLKNWWEWKRAGVLRDGEKFGQKFQMIGDKQCKKTVIRQDILEYSCKC